MKLTGDGMKSLVDQDFTYFIVKYYFILKYSGFYILNAMGNH